LKEAILALLNATSAFPKPKMQSGAQLSVPTDWFDLGATDDGNFVLRFRLSSGGEFSFLLPRGMAANLQHVLTETLQPGSIAPAPG
jgi:hypothetical protein